VNPFREIQLRPQDRKQVERILSHFVPNEEVWAYGSRVDGSGHELSNLDLVIRHPADLKNFRGSYFGGTQRSFQRKQPAVSRGCARLGEFADGILGEHRSTTRLNPTRRTGV
jgi:hypothetical protein